MARVVIRNLILLVGLYSVNLAQAQVKLSGKENIRYLALGDSYTIGESVPEEQRWPMQLAERLRDKGYRVDKPVIIARTGWRTDQLRDAIVASGQPLDFNLVSLLIGVNNQYQKRSVESYTPEFRQLLEMAIAHAGGRKDRVFVVSIPDYGFTPFGEPRKDQITSAIDAFNARNKAIADSAGVVWFNITDISRRGLTEPDLVASDKLHPSGKMYEEWVDRILAGFRLK